ncbi:hypothetical protein [Chitinophaga varians]|uniref:hypothetical protein n=1 Tax=Chitinophaga varians TaxID=2202339 RepID=UPI00165F4121|nr:hypothetical protein [Chitinophaga varians]MBC9914821.1 hypothetical protein [Chitinophaga varians]
MRVLQLLLLLPLTFVPASLQAQQQESKAATAIRHLKESTRAGLDSLDREQEKMENDAARLKKDAVADYKKEKASIKKHEAKLRQQVKEETKVADDKWESFKTSVEKDFHELQQRVHHLKEKIKKQLPGDNHQLQDEPPTENNTAPTTLLT